MSFSFETEDFFGSERRNHFRFQKKTQDPRSIEKVIYNFRSSQKRRKERERESESESESERERERERE